MSSTNKTTNLKLNDWVGTDVPQREDFNADNQRIDKAIGDHTGNTAVHITQAERDLWGLPFYYYNYFGNGKATRKVEVPSPSALALPLSLQTVWRPLCANSPAAPTTTMWPLPARPAAPSA